MSFYVPTEEIYIKGVSFFTPKKVMTNEALTDWMGVILKPSLIEKRTGIKTRYWVEDETCSDLGFLSASKLLSQYEIDPKSIGTLILSTISGDYSSPPSAPLIQDRLSLENIGSFDFSAACAGFTSGLILSQSLCQSSHKDVLLVSSEIRSKYLSKKDFQTNALFGDGSSSTLITKEKKGSSFSFIGGELLSDGSVADIISIPCGGSNQPYDADAEMYTLRMKASTELFLKALNGMYQSSLSLLGKLKLTIDDIDWIVPHQANLHMIQALIRKFNFPEQRVVQTVKMWGNTSGASVGMALGYLLESDDFPLKSGEKVLLISAGGGGLAANAVLEVL